MLDHPYYDDAMGLSEAADFLELSQVYFRGAYREIGAPFEKFCGRVIFRQCELEKWRDSRVNARKRGEAATANAFNAMDMQREARASK